MTCLLKNTFSCYYKSGLIHNAGRSTKKNYFYDGRLLKNIIITEVTFPMVSRIETVAKPPK